MFKSRVLGVIVTYHPEASVLLNVNTLLEQVSYVIIVDNESTEQSLNLLSRINRPDRVFFIFNKNNLGVGEAFNQGLRWGIQNEYEYFLLMDQDSYTMPGMVNELVLAAAAKVNAGELVLVGPQHEDFNRKILAKNKIPIESVALLITSGCLIPKSVLDEVGFYDERLFIDHVDHDFAIRVLRKGGSCLKVNSATLMHKFGDAEIRKFFGKTFFIQNYSPTRRYFMMRNRVILYRRYGMFRESWFWLDLRSAVKDLIKLVFFESEKLPKLIGVARGLIHGIYWS